MKKVNFKKVLMALVAVFALTVFSVERAEAQAINEFSSGLYDPAPGTFLGSDEAQDVLVNGLMDLKNTLVGLTPGSPVYQAILKTVNYHSGIYHELQNGKSVSVAIGTGLGSLTNSADGAIPSRYELKELRQGAIDLLQ